MKKGLKLGISNTLIYENHKMHWYIPVLTFLAYFFAGIFPLIMNFESLSFINEFGNPSNWVLYAQDCLKNQNPFYLMFMAGVPLVIAMIALGYYHKPERTFAFVSQPYSRSKIFLSQAVSGIYMMILPLVLIAIIYILLMGQVKDSDVNGAIIAAYTLKDVLKWLFSEFSMMTFLYSIYLLAGSLVGTSVMMLLLSGVFFGVVPVALLFTIATMEEFVVGFYASPDWATKIMEYSNPLVLNVTKNFGVTGSTYIFYLVAAILFIALALIAVNKAKLENVGEGMIFSAIEELVTWVVSFLGGAGFGLILVELFNNTGLTNITGLIVGGVLSFALVKIITNRSIKIFNRRNLRSFICAMAILVLFFMVSVLDITGFTDKVPKVERIESVDVYNFSNAAGSIYFEGFYNVDDFNDIERVTDPVVIEKMVELHQYIVDNKLYDKNEKEYEIEYPNKILESRAIEQNEDLQSDTDIDEEGYYEDTLYFMYKMKNGSVFERQFDVVMDEHTIKEAESILKSQPRGEWTDKILSLKGDLSINIYLYEDLVDYDYQYEDGYDPGENLSKYTILNVRKHPEILEQTLQLTEKEDIEKLLRAHDMDARDVNYTERLIFNGGRIPDPYARMNGEFNVVVTDTKKNVDDDDYLKQGYFYITGQDENVIEVLIDMGYIIRQ